MGFSWLNEGKKKRKRDLTLCLVQKTCPAPPSGLEPAERQAQRCVGVNSADTDTPTQTQTHTWSSTVTSVPSVLSVFHFWLKLRPSSFILYLVSRLPEALPESVLLEPDVLNSCVWRGGGEQRFRSLCRFVLKKTGGVGDQAPEFASLLGSLLVSDSLSLGHACSFVTSASYRLSEPPASFSVFSRDNDSNSTRWVWCRQFPFKCNVALLLSDQHRPNWMWIFDRKTQRTEK